jgi:hypothetical protein
MLSLLFLPQTHRCVGNSLLLHLRFLFCSILSLFSALDALLFILTLWFTVSIPLVPFLPNHVLHLLLRSYTFCHCFILAPPYLSYLHFILVWLSVMSYSLTFWPV